MWPKRKSRRKSLVDPTASGIKTAEVQPSQFAEGPISLQFGNLEKGARGEPIKWRKVEIRPL
jgi:hypothetical protein